MTALAEWCASEGMPIAYHHHMAAPIETELDQLMKHSGEALSLLYDAGQYGVHLRCTPGEAARAVNFIASDDAGMITGAIVNYDQSDWGVAVTMPVPDGPMMLSPG